MAPTLQLGSILLILSLSHQAMAQLTFINREGVVLGRTSKVGVIKEHSGRLIASAHSNCSETNMEFAIAPYKANFYVAWKVCADPWTQENGEWSFRCTYQDPNGQEQCRDCGKKYRDSSRDSDQPMLVKGPVLTVKFNAPPGIDKSIIFAYCFFDGITETEEACFTDMEKECF
ncbi:uncharacterized protein LOC135466264 [Liolophura sinensis]|uniref:uncharacterized protein LOC135466264 n=1 Tax=Liolophura sinensis TaxID=3198878 RepID=UPI003158B4F1